MLIKIKSPDFTAGLEYNADTKIVTNAAPELSWAVGKDIDYVLALCRIEGYEYEKISLLHSKFWEKDDQ